MALFELSEHEIGFRDGYSRRTNYDWDSSTLVNATEYWQGYNRGAAKRAADELELLKSVGHA